MASQNSPQTPSTLTSGSSAVSRTVTGSPSGPLGLAAFGVNTPAIPELPRTEEDDEEDSMNNLGDLENPLRYLYQNAARARSIGMSAAGQVNAPPIDTSENSQNQSDNVLTPGQQQSQLEASLSLAQFTETADESGTPSDTVSEQSAGSQDQRTVSNQITTAPRPNPPNAAADASRNPQPTQDDPAAALAVSAASAPLTSFAIPPGYPAPALIMTDAARVGQLLSSGLLEKLRCLRFEILQQSGPTVIQTTFGRANMSTYEQFVFAVAAKYYSTLPLANYDLRTFQLLHQIMTSFSRPGFSIPLEYEVNNEAFSNIITAGLAPLGVKLGQLLLKRESINARNLSSVMTELEGATSFEELGRAYPTAIVVYRMFYRYLYHGQAEIEPIPELILDEINLAPYLEGIGRGTGIITMEHINIQPRPAQLVPPPTAQAGFAVVPNQLPTPAGQENDQGETTTLPTLPTPNQLAAIDSALGQTSRPAPPSNANLMAQGNQGMVQVIRDTTSFRASIDATNALRTAVDELTRQGAEHTRLLTAIGNTLTELVARVGRLDNTLAGVIQQSATTNLIDTTNINRVMFGPTDASASDIINRAPPQTPASTNNIHDFIRRIEAMTGLADDPQLPAAIRAELSSRGAENLHPMFVDTAFNNPLSRRRMVLKLRPMGGAAPARGA